MAEVNNTVPIKRIYDKGTDGNSQVLFHPETRAEAVLLDGGKSLATYIQELELLRTKLANLTDGKDGVGIESRHSKRAYCPRDVSTEKALHDYEAALRAQGMEIWRTDGGPTLDFPAIWEKYWFVYTNGEESEPVVTFCGFYGASPFYYLSFDNGLVYIPKNNNNTVIEAYLSLYKNDGEGRITSEAFSNLEVGTTRMQKITLPTTNNGVSQRYSVVSSNPNIEMTVLKIADSVNTSYKIMFYINGAFTDNDLDLKFVVKQGTSTFRTSIRFNQVITYEATTYLGQSFRLRDWDQIKDGEWIYTNIKYDDWDNDLASNTNEDEFTEVENGAINRMPIYYDMVYYGDAKDGEPRPIYICKKHHVKKKDEPNASPRPNLYALNEEEDPYWKKVVGYDFIQANQAYIEHLAANSVEAHRILITNGEHIVAGIIDGKSALSDYGDYIDGSQENTPVRIFAGLENNKNDLRESTFYVTEDGTVQMKKGNIIGNVNIGENVEISGDVHITGNVVIENSVQIGGEGDDSGGNTDPGGSTQEPIDTGLIVDDVLERLKKEPDIKLNVDGSGSFTGTVNARSFGFINDDNRVLAKFKYFDNLVLEGEEQDPGLFFGIKINYEDDLDDSNYKWLPLSLFKNVGADFGDISFVPVLGVIKTDLVLNDDGGDSFDIPIVGRFTRHILNSSNVTDTIVGYYKVIDGEVEKEDGNAIIYQKPSTSSSRVHRLDNVFLPVSGLTNSIEVIKHHEGYPGTISPNSIPVSPQTIKAYELKRIVNGIIQDDTRTTENVYLFRHVNYKQQYTGYVTDLSEGKEKYGMDNLKIQISSYYDNYIYLYKYLASGGCFMKGNSIRDFIYPDNTNHFYKVSNI